MNQRISKAQLVEAVAERAYTKKKDAEKVVNATLGAIADALVNGDEVMLMGFGLFKVSKRGEHMASNPQTGKKIRVPARNIPTFKAGAMLKKRVNQ